ncbi:deoxyribodipyrimidine photo-lyase [Pseudoflavitalea sp. G-6-1-2]|uniref:cryptochrome/photolyase family protein n=1 Tax=Pseudoflavitalea sp. G-6-1-2 TaxID=2728841 RepID=UPI00146CDFAB|nr:deoxyribodipyrimidine photo-lyase [Pseudoflavitalea sp. G-6-1-2]NML22679.1 deoxyribodipyrimidine photo-lyase [Pseudoflavitalea sp. G-6-1-2]
MKKVTVFWFRRDLRLEDNNGLAHALRQSDPVLPVFIFDKNILDQLDNKADRRVEFIHAALLQMQEQLLGRGSSLHVLYDTPLGAFRQLLKQYEITAVFTNRDYERYAIDRDEAIRTLLQEHNIPFQSFKDQVIFDQNEVVKDDGKPYTVFTPYSRKWLSVLANNPVTHYDDKKQRNHFLQQSPITIPGLRSIGFQAVDQPFPSQDLPKALLQHYGERRDFPSIAGTSKLGVHLRFGTISIRKILQQALPLSNSFVNELIWRDFYQMICWHFPQIGQGRAFRPAYDLIRWRNNEEEFEKWKTGQTGYPIVDAGMRELNATGFMHNRVRMIVASFLSKHLLIDWRWGEAYFAEKLLDYDFASNNGGWQWAAGSGCDAAPYFRVFNPTLQAKKFDPEGKYISKWVPEINDFGYPEPIVNHEMARMRCLGFYSKALKNSE